MTHFDVAPPFRAAPAGLKPGATAPGIAIAVFSAASTFVPSPARRRFFAKLCAVANEVWQFHLDAENRLRLTCTQPAVKKQLNH